MSERRPRYVVVVSAVCAAQGVEQISARRFEYAPFVVCDFFSMKSGTVGDKGNDEVAMREGGVNYLRPCGRPNYAASMPAPDR